MLLPISSHDKDFATRLSRMTSSGPSDQSRSRRRREGVLASNSRNLSLCTGSLIWMLLMYLIGRGVDEGVDKIEIVREISHPSTLRFGRVSGASTGGSTHSPARIFVSSAPNMLSVRSSSITGCAARNVRAVAGLQWTPFTRRTRRRGQ